MGLHITITLSITYLSYLILTYDTFYNCKPQALSRGIFLELVGIIPEGILEVWNPPFSVAFSDS